MKRSTTYKHPTTYEEIVAHEHDRHAARLRSLKRAERTIRAVSADLSALATIGRHISVDDHSMYLRDCRHLFENRARSTWALYLDTGVFSESAGRTVDVLLDRGWIVEAVSPDRSLPRVLLRRPKTQLRITLSVAAEYADSLRAREVRV
jgi:hypothetical protein